MTDNEIIKGLECCSKESMLNCRKCPYEQNCNMGGSKMQADALDLVNRQKAEIERLESLCEKIGIANDVKLERIYVLQEDLETAKAEAIKEFAERLCEGRVSNDPVVIAAKCLVKEMTD